MTILYYASLLLGLTLTSYLLYGKRHKRKERPTFFYSKFRVTLLVICVTIFITIGSRGLYIIGYPTHVLWVSAFYFLIVNYIILNRNVRFIARGILERYYAISISNPEITQEDRLWYAADQIVFRFSNTFEQYNTRMDFIDEAMREKKLVTALDLPSALFPIITQGERKKALVYKNDANISRAQVEVLYNDVMSGKKQNDFLFLVKNLIKDKIEPHLRFTILKSQRPDFAIEPVELDEYLIEDKEDGDYFARLAYFPNYPSSKAIKYGYFKDQYCYAVFADLEFSRRYPDHDKSKITRRLLSRYSDDDIFAIGKGQIEITFND